jgi:hypothetical protein
MASSGLALRDGMSFAEWAAVGQRLGRISSGSAWALGDWINYGQAAYGRRYAEALHATALDYKTLRNYAWVARRFTPERRRPGLSFQHHADVAGLSEAEQSLWLSRCDTLRWSRSELRRQLARAAADAPQAPGRVIRITVADERERSWREAAERAQCSLADLITEAVDRAVEALRTDTGEDVGIRAAA